MALELLVDGANKRIDYTGAEGEDLAYNLFVANAPNEVLQTYDAAGRFVVDRKTYDQWRRVFLMLGKARSAEGEIARRASPDHVRRLRSLYGLVAMHPLQDRVRVESTLAQEYMRALIERDDDVLQAERASLFRATYDHLLDPCFKTHDDLRGIPSDWSAGRVAVRVAHDVDTSKMVKLKKKELTSPTLIQIFDKLLSAYRKSSMFAIPNVVVSGTSLEHTRAAIVLDWLWNTVLPPVVPDLEAAFGVDRVAKMFVHKTRKVISHEIKESIAEYGPPEETAGKRECIYIMDAAGDAMRSFVNGEPVQAVDKVTWIAPFVWMFLPPSFDSSTLLNVTSLIGRLLYVHERQPGEEQV